MTGTFYWSFIQLEGRIGELSVESHRQRTRSTAGVDFCGLFLQFRSHCSKTDREAPPFKVHYLL